MDPLEFLILVFAVTINFTLLGFVYFRNQRSATHKLFALLTLVMSLWSVVNYFAVNPTSEATAKWGVRGVMFFAVPMSVLFFLLMHTYPRSTMSLSRKALTTWVVLTVITMAVALSPLLFPEVKYVPGLPPVPTPGAGMVLFIPVGVGTVPLGIYYLLKKMRHARGVQKTQLHFLALGTVIMYGLIISLNFISVNVFKVSTFNKFGPLFTLPFSILTSYTIVRYRLMDIRAAIARSLSFSALLGAFFATYSAILIFAVPPLADWLDIREGFIAAVGALLAVLLARYVQETLRRLTDRFLFQNQIDYRHALVDSSKELSTTIKIEDVTTTVLDIMEKIIRTKKTIIFLQENVGHSVSRSGFVFGVY